ncbi:MAG: ribonuclease G [Sedimenticola sp.]|uniref:Ribonuclease G n=1 Tax=Sedimenticola thiotaurini TaxID=1543721 RepID=A0A558DG23_9GAMM|nr:ribonuclease G [Sedimenticola sp.]MCW8949006.1 ribonuclease G [Sedimenticola sp.]MCW8975902.1 ribonuclease G [Sedimenticola sp.]MCW9022653.1 ribonuclease G [Sedimenticola sp.]TVT59932.1 MAG: ribonuclease G [Sedimenticola thiotaurini]
MSEEILVNVTPPETRVAVIENGVVQEIIIERAQRRGLVGNIYKGKVCRVLPGMQAAFVDIGLERAAFLHASDISSSNSESNENINELVRDGAEVIVQVVKDPLGTKGARLTTHISIPSRYLVFMPELTNLGVSQKIEDEQERNRLRDIVCGFFGDSSLKGNFIIRTAAEGVDEETLKSDIRFLTRLWHAIQDRLQTSPAKQLIHEDLPLYLRSLRDLITADVERLRIDSRENWQRLTQFAEKLIPDSPVKIEYYPGERPIFDLYGVEDEIQKALDQKVTLKSGGYLIIDQTEAMTTIDVNTGAFVGHRNQEETIFKTNMEAAQAICRQLRLRNLGGIIIIDFIDMTEEEHKRQVLRALEKCLARDHSKTHITEVSSLGLVEMTRKRTRESLEHILCEPCPCCGGRGSLKTAETTCYEIFREILREARQFDVESLLVLASQEVVDRLLDEESATLAELGSFIGKTIRLQAEALYSQEHYDVVLI